MNKPAKAKTFTYVCGHSVTVEAGGIASSRIQAAIRGGLKCFKCRKFDVLSRLRYRKAEELLAALMRRATISDLEVIAEELEETP